MSSLLSFSCIRVGYNWKQKIKISGGDQDSQQSFNLIQRQSNKSDLKFTLLRLTPYRYDGTLSISQAWSF